MLDLIIVARYVSWRGRRGQSLVIAVAKWIGTLAPTILFGWLESSVFIIGIGVSCSVFDLVCIALLVRDPLGHGSAAGLRGSNSASSQPLG